jgi:hypothetical protein
MSIELLQPFRPVLSAPSFEGAGYEVLGWVFCHRWRALGPWLRLLVDRNMHGTIPFGTNPEPWPHYYDGIQAAEVSHGRRPWNWTTVLAFFPFTTASQVWDVLSDLREFAEVDG